MLQSVRTRIDRHPSRTYSAMEVREKMTPLTKKISAAILSLALFMPAGSAFAITRHHHRRTYSSTTYHRKHYSQAGGALVGAAAGEGVQYYRNKRVRH